MFKKTIAIAFSVIGICTYSFAQNTTFQTGDPIIDNILNSISSNTSTYGNKNTSTIINNQTTQFTITLGQNPIKKGEKVDMNIKAIKADGSIDKNYRGTIIMDLEGTQDTNMYDLPSNGFYQFTAEDKGIKTFKKGLKFNKSGTYTLIVFDSNVDSIVGTLPFVVGSTQTTKNITHSNTINSKTGYKKQYKNFNTFMSSEYGFTYKKSFANVNRYCKIAKLRGINTYFNENACEPMFKEIVQAANNILDEAMNGIGLDSNSNTTGYQAWIANRPEFRKGVIESYNSKKKERLSVHDDILKSLVIIFFIKIDYIINNEIYNSL